MPLLCPPIPMHTHVQTSFLWILKIPLFLLSLHVMFILFLHACIFGHFWPFLGLDGTCLLFPTLWHLAGVGQAFSPYHSLCGVTNSFLQTLCFFWNRHMRSRQRKDRIKDGTDGRMAAVLRHGMARCCCMGWAGRHRQRGQNMPTKFTTTAAADRTNPRACLARQAWAVLHGSVNAYRRAWDVSSRAGAAPSFRAFSSPVGWRRVCAGMARSMGNWAPVHSTCFDYYCFVVAVYMTFLVLWFSCSVAWWRGFFPSSTPFQHLFCTRYFGLLLSIR